MYNFKYDGSKFKLQICDERYYVNEKKRTVTVSARVRVMVPDFVAKTINFMQLPDGFLPDLWCGDWGDWVVMKYTARCSDEDEFDAEKGKKIAMAKLEAGAYLRMAKTMRNWCERFAGFANTVVAMGDFFINKAYNSASHDIEYVGRIS